MTAYELITAIDPATIDILLSTGYLRPMTLRDVAIYEFYVNERRLVTCMQARTNTAENFCTSEETISRIIKKMK